MTKTALVTGCSTGFGKATARAFLAAGWNVVATMRSPERETELVNGEHLLVTRLDVQDRSSIDAAVSEALARFGTLDALVNNAGFGLHGVFEETTRERIQEQLDVNLFGLMDTTRAVLPAMRRQRSGVIVNVSSGAGVFALPMMSAYCASKFALEGWSEALSYELAALGIAVKIVEPGGATSTRFVERTGAEAAQNHAIPDYAPFVRGVAAIFEELAKQRGGGSADDVARVILEAVTDGTNRLRYLGTENIRSLVELRRQTNEETYLARMRAAFTPKLA